MSLRAWAASAVLIAALTGCSLPATLTPPAAQAAASAPAKDATDPTGLAAQGWTITTIAVKPDAAGDWGANARITNATGADRKVATFTVTVLDASKNIMATMVGSAMNVAKGEAVTVQFLSTDKYTAGTHFYAFQVDASF